MIKLTRMELRNDRTDKFFVAPSRIIRIDFMDLGDKHGTAVLLDHGVNTITEYVLETPEQVVQKIAADKRGNIDAITPVMVGIVQAAETLTKERISSAAFDNRLRILEDIATARHEGDNEMSDRFERMLSELPKSGATFPTGVMKPPAPVAKCNTCVNHKTLPTEAPCAQCLNVDGKPLYEQR